MNEANSQRYYPKYVLHTNNNLITLQQVAPSDQLVNAVALSWDPYDVASRNQETPPAVSATREVCDQIFKEAGTNLSDRTTELNAMRECAALLFFKAVLDGRARPNSTSFRSAVDQLGTAYQSSTNYLTKLGAGRHDGASRTRVLGFDVSCTCFVYRAVGPDF
jgi:hypothetical protein